MTSTCESDVWSRASRVGAAASERLTQSSWCEEAGEDEQACGPHGLLFFPPAAGGPSHSVSVMARLGGLLWGGASFHGDQVTSRET